MFYFSTKLKRFQLFQIGTDVVLSCKVANFYDVQWLKSRTELSTNTKYRLKNDGLVHKLIIINAQRDDAGDYVCRCCYDRTECTIKAGSIIMNPVTRKERSIFLKLSNKQPFDPYIYIPADRVFFCIRLNEV